MFEENNIIKFKKEGIVVQFLPEAKNLGFRLSRIYENKKSKI